MKKYGITALFLIFIWLLTEIVFGCVLLPFSLIDDPYNYLKYLEVENSINWNDAFGNFLFEFPGISEGRFAFFWWFVYVARYWLAGINPLLHHIIHFSMNMITALLIYLLTKNKTENAIAALLAVIFFVVSGLGSENWLRISTLESIQALTLMVFVYSLEKKDISVWLSVISFCLFVFAKENSLLFFPIFWLWPILEKKVERRKKLTRINLITSIFALFVLVLWKITNRQTWAGGNAALENIIPSFLTYWKIIWRLWYPQVLAFFLAVWIVCTDKKYKNIVLKIMLVGLWSVVALLPWRFALQRYLFIFPMTVAIVVAIIVYEIYLLKLSLYKFGLVMICSFVIVRWGYTNLVERNNFIQTYTAWEINNGKMLSRLSQLPNNSQVLINVGKNHYDAHEWVTMMPKYMSVFYGRDDLRIGFIDDEKLTTKNTYIADWSVYRNDGQIDEEKLIWQNSQKANLAVGSIKSRLKNLLLRTNVMINIDKDYWWKIYDISSR